MERRVVNPLAMLVASRTFTRSPLAALARLQDRFALNSGPGDDFLFYVVVVVPVKVLVGSILDSVVDLGTNDFVRRRVS